MKIYKLGLLAFFTVFLLSCEKETEGLSRVTYFADFEMTGSDFYFAILNSTFTDPGIKAFEDGKELSVTTTGTVDTSSPGIYQLTYSAINSDGFSASVSRMVAVVNALPTEDYSGSYIRQPPQTANPATITKIGGILGYYRTTDGGNQSGTRVPLDFVDMGDGTLLIPLATSVFGPFKGGGSFLSDGRINFDFTYVDGVNLGYRMNTIWQKQ